MGKVLTVLGVLPSDLGDGIANFVSDNSLGLGAQCLEQFLANNNGLVLGKGVEEVKILSSLDLSRLGRDASEDDSGKGPCLEESEKPWSASGGVGRRKAQKMKFCFGGVETYSVISSTLNLFSQAHQQNLWSTASPVIL